MKFENGLEFLNKLRIIFYSLLGGHLLLFFFLVLKESEGQLSIFINLGDSSLLFRWVVTLMLVSITIGAYFFYNRSLNITRDHDNLREQLLHYWQINLRKYILLELSCILSLICFFLTLEPVFKGLYVMLMVAMAMSNPGLYAILKDLRADSEDAIVLKRNLPIP